MNNRFRTPQWETTVEATSNTLEETLVLNENASDPWVNTVQVYSTSSSKDKRYVTLSLPAGFSTNSMSDKVIRGKAGWIVVEKPNDIVENGEWTKFCDMGYERCFEDGRLMIFMRK